MCLLLETIKCFDGKLENIDFHQQRFEFTQNSLFGIKKSEALEQVIKIPEYATSGMFRCRVFYNEKIESAEFLPYSYRQIKTLRIIESNKTNYRYKYADRKHLEQLFELKRECDDIIIVKDGFITDSFAANLIFFDGKKWWTPDTPLLKGTKREKLLTENRISECRISISDLNKYTHAGLINAMIDLNQSPEIQVENIRR